MSGGGGGGGNTWVFVLVGGVVACAIGYGLEFTELAPHSVIYGLLAIGGLGVVFGSCESMILAVQGIGARMGWNPFVAGTMAGLASNIPEIVMLAFVVAAAPRVAFVVVALTLHVNALTFGIYSGMLPRDRSGQARMPDALVKISTDLFAAGGGVFLATGSLMVVMQVFRTGDHGGDGFGVVDLYAVGVCLLLVQVVSVKQMLGTPVSDEPPASGETAIDPAKESASPTNETSNDPPPSWLAISGYGLLGGAASLLGGHAVGDFADGLVNALNDAGYPEMVGAIILSVFAGAGAFVMVATAHAKGLHEIALAGISGAITQVPFVVLPFVMILIAAFSQLGWIPTMASGAVLPIDLETTSVVLLAFPPMLILWKSVQDDGKVNWTETAGMVAVFGITIYFLAQHG